MSVRVCCGTSFGIILNFKFAIEQKKIHQQMLLEIRNYLTYYYFYKLFYFNYF